MSDPETQQDPTAIPDGEVIVVTANLPPIVDPNATEIPVSVARQYLDDIMRSNSQFPEPRTSRRIDAEIRAEGLGGGEEARAKAMADAKGAIASL